jgi:hypothetical protein
MGIALFDPMISSQVILMRVPGFSYQDHDKEQIQHRHSIHRPSLGEAIATTMCILPALNDTTSGTST